MQAYLKQRARLEAEILNFKFMLQDLSDPNVKEYALTNMFVAP